MKHQSCEQLKQDSQFFMFDKNNRLCTSIFSEFDGVVC